MRFSGKQQGFSLIELMISLALGAVITGAVIQVMVSNSVTDRLNRAIASSQESGRFAIARLREEILPAGRYEPLDPLLSRGADIAGEAAFIQNRPVPLPGDFVSQSGVGASQGAGGANDVLTVALQANEDCRGYKLGYLADEEFFVVNQYFVQNNTLKCVGYDGRYLRGQKAAVGHSAHAAFSLVDDVERFQVLYGVANHARNGDNTARPSRFVTADQLAAEYAANSQVVAIRIAILLKGDTEVVVNPIPSFSLLNEAAYTPASTGLYKQFETTITLRNAKNFIRNRKL